MINYDICQIDGLFLYILYSILNNILYLPSNNLRN